MDLRNTRTTILNSGDAEEKREEIRQYFHDTYTLDEKLYETLASDEAFYLRPEPLRHPLIFYLGHTATFYVNKLIVGKLSEQRFNPRFDRCSRSAWTRCHPLFWIESPDGYKFRTMARVIDMPWNWPVEVNYLEAKAFCNWMAKRTGKAIRLPSEDQWYRLRDTCDIPDQPYWEKAPGNINLEHWASSCPVDRFAFGGFYDVIGNVWQWTETPITGFDGFGVHPSYDDFSTPTFDTQHNIFKGGSWISTGNEATRDSRYAFRRHFFQHAGFRYVESEQPLEEPEAMYDTDSAVAQYCEAHYGKEYFGVQNFPKQCVEACFQHTQGRPRQAALELGCAVGRASFELAREFEQVTGLDFSARFIRVAEQLKQKGNCHYELIEEGEVVSYHEASLSSVLGADVNWEELSGRVGFWQGDATNLKPRFTGYDLILAANMLDRLSEPKRFLENVHERLNMGGVLVLTSPYTWLEEFTKKENWPGGIRKAGEPYMTIDAMVDLLSPHFKMIDEPRDLEFVTRETRRKFQHSLAEMTVWERIA